jgi:hypothetical protein
LEIKDPSDWYSISRHDVDNHGGYSLLHHYYNDHLGKALQTLYPNIEWQQWRFARVPTGYWDSMENQRKFMEYIGNRLDFQVIKFNVIIEYD